MDEQVAARDAQGEDAAAPGRGREARRDDGGDRVAVDRLARAEPARVLDGEREVENRAGVGLCGTDAVVADPAGVSGERLEPVVRLGREEAELETAREGAARSGPGLDETARRADRERHDLAATRLGGKLAAQHPVLGVIEPSELHGEVAVLDGPYAGPNRHRLALGG